MAKLEDSRCAAGDCESIPKSHRNSSHSQEKARSARNAYRHLPVLEMAGRRGWSDGCLTAFERRGVQCFRRDLSVSKIQAKRQIVFCVLVENHDGRSSAGQPGGVGRCIDSGRLEFLREAGIENRSARKRAGKLQSIRDRLKEIFRAEGRNRRVKGMRV